LTKDPQYNCTRYHHCTQRWMESTKWDTPW